MSAQTAQEFWAPCPECGREVQWIAHPTSVYDFDINCDCSRKRWRR